MEAVGLGAKALGIKACLFDAYGTLLDFSTIAATCPAIPPALRQSFTALWRERQLAYTWLRTLQDSYVDFGRIVADSARYAFAACDLHPTPAAFATLLDAYAGLPAFPDAPAALAALRKRGLRLGVLSNGTPAMLTQSFAGAGLDGWFDPIVSADRLGRYKTHPSLYAEGLRQLDLPPTSVLFVSANGWDAYAASAFGMVVAWINRARAPAECLPGQPDAVLPALAALDSLFG